MKAHPCRLFSQTGLSLVELLVAMTVGLLLLGAVIEVYLAQTRIYRIASAQASIQNAENAIAALLTPVIRAAGFVGCSTLQQTLFSNLNPGGPPPLGALATPRLLWAYDATGTAVGGSLTLTQVNAANDSDVTHWTPALDGSLASQVATGSDVLVLLGAAAGSQPVALTAVDGGSNTLTVQDASGLVAGQIAAVSDCNLASIFQITSVAGTTLGHQVGGTPQTNAAAAFPANSNNLLIPLQQTAIYVAQGQGGQSVLTLATYSAGVWAVAPLVPGVATLQVLYGIGSNGVITQYVAGNAVSTATPVYTVRLAFLIEGQPGSASASNPVTFTLLGTTVNVPQDTRLRRVFEMTVKLRNAT